MCGMHYAPGNGSNIYCMHLPEFYITFAHTPHSYVYSYLVTWTDNQQRYGTIEK